MVRSNINTGEIGNNLLRDVLSRYIAKYISIHSAKEKEQILVGSESG